MDNTLLQQRLAALGHLDAARLEAGADTVRAVLRKPALGLNDFNVLLSSAASSCLEEMAVRARDETLRHFGRARQLFAPLYLANYCSNKCVYCGFHAGAGIERKALEPGEIEAEAEALSTTGLRRVLALTGDAPMRTGAPYIASAVGILTRHFSSVGIEVQALTRDEYALVVDAGADSMTMFQETYDEALYERLHPAGPKRDFAFRLNAPERAAGAGMRGLTLGALLGLGDWRFDMLRLVVHGQWLQRRHPHLELSFSLPRIRPLASNNESAGGNKAVFVPKPVSDREFVQALTALRCFMPHAGITLSTRENARMRDNLLPLGATRLSAGVCTGVGGYAKEGSDPQFVIDDGRGVGQMARDMARLGFQPVFADWLVPVDEKRCPAALDEARPLAGKAPGQGFGRRLGAAASKAPAASGAVSPLRRGLAAHLPPDRLKRLAGAKVGLAGAGGLGSNAAMLLARSGVGRFVLVDGDTVDEGNLNRQFFWPDDIGRSKVDALRERLLDLEPGLEVETVNAYLAPEDAARVFDGCDAVVEALDDAAVKCAVCEGLLAAGFFVAAASGLGGTGGSMERRVLGDRLVCVGDFSAAVDAAHPALAPRVMQAAAMQADAILERLLAS